MATFEIFMPALSSTMTEGKIVEWLKQPGDRGERGESVVVVESDKADMDVESFEAGFLGAVLLPAGGTAPVGETIGLGVETEAELAELKANGPATPAASAPAAAPAPAPAPSATPAPTPEPAEQPRQQGRGQVPQPAQGAVRELLRVRVPVPVRRQGQKRRGWPVRWP